jgi:hypothetical protein
MDRLLTCPDAFAPVCGDGVVISCENGYQVAEDCVVDGNTCQVVEQEARCALEPLTTCDPDSYINHCDGQKEIRCDRGLVRAEDCAVKDPPQTCTEYRDNYGRYAYCIAPNT